MSKQRNLIYTAQCRKCRNMFDIYIKAFPSKEEPDWWTGWVEQSTDLQIMDDGAPYCRCGGELRLMGNDIKLRFKR